jgi:hypothetical protein
LTITVCHYPTGCSKWNPIEHRLFSEVSKTWAGCPLRSWEMILQYIRKTKAETGLTARAVLVTAKYETGKVSDEGTDSTWNTTPFAHNGIIPFVHIQQFCSTNSRSYFL